MRGYVNQSQGGMTPNGLIETYTVETGNTINVGDFVSWVNDRKVEPKAFSSYGNFDICKITETKFLMVWNDSGNGQQTSAVIYNVVDGVFTAGTSIVIRAATGTASYAIRIGMLSSSKFIVFYHGLNTNAVILNVDGSDNITKGTANTNIGISGTAYKEICVISSTKVIFHGGNGNVSVGLVVCNIDGSDNITTGAIKTWNGAYYNCIQPISSTKFLILNSAGSGGTTKAVVATIDGSDNITTGTEYDFTAFYTNCKLISLSSSKFVFLYTYPLSSYVVVLNVNGSDIITLGTPKNLDENIIISTPYDLVKVTSNTIMVNYNKIYQSRLRNYTDMKCIFTIDGSDNITKGIEHSIKNNSNSTTFPRLIYINSTNILDAYSDSISVGEMQILNINNGLIQPIGTKNKIIKATDTIFIAGVAKTAGSQGSNISIYTI